MMKVVFILVLVPMYDVSEYDVSRISVQYYCITHSYINVLACICMYRLKYMYQCIRTNPILIGKEGKNRMYLEN